MHSIEYQCCSWFFSSSKRTMIQEDQTFHYQFKCGVFVILPEHGVSEFPPLLPLVIKPESLAEAGSLTSPLSNISSFPASTSLRDISPGWHDASSANIKQLYQTKASITSSFSFPYIGNIWWQFTSPNVVVSRQQKVSAWHNAILRKHKLVLQSL